jgi:hypothetical protein
MLAHEVLFRGLIESHDPLNGVIVEVHQGGERIAEKARDTRR